jgi:phospholipid/cholesterol/gamma-HCH transport system substrate-binding protein
MSRCWRRAGAAVLIALAVAALSGCGALRNFRGANSLPLPGRAGVGKDAYTVYVQMPDVINLKENARVYYNDVLAGNIGRIQRQGWHALVTLTIDPEVQLPANATATVGQTSLLGTLHIELAPPKGVAPKGRLHDGSVIPLSSAGAYPSTEETLGAVSLLLNGGGLGSLQDITSTLSIAFSGREKDLKSLVTELDKFTAYLDDQKGDIIASFESFNNLVGQLAEQKPVIDRALKTFPEGFRVLDENAEILSDALGVLGPRLGTDIEKIFNPRVNENATKVVNDVGPVLQSLADAGPSLTRGLDYILLPLFSKPGVTNWIRGDYGNITAILDLTLSRLDAHLLTGTFLEGELTELELQYGRTVGTLPSPYTARNPITVPYQFNQGP